MSEFQLVTRFQPAGDRLYSEQSTLVERIHAMTATMILCLFMSAPGAVQDDVKPRLIDAHMHAYASDVNVQRIDALGGAAREEALRVRYFVCRVPRSRSRSRLSASHARSMRRGVAARASSQWLSRDQDHVRVAGDVIRPLRRDGGPGPRAVPEGWRY